MKYKVGDKVRVLSDLDTNTIYGRYFPNYSMMDFKGKIVTIKSLDGNGSETYRIVEQPFGKQWWTDEMFSGKVIDAEPELPLPAPEPIWEWKLKREAIESWRTERWRKRYDDEEWAKPSYEELLAAWKPMPREEIEKVIKTEQAQIPTPAPEPEEKWSWQDLF